MASGNGNVVGFKDKNNPAGPLFETGSIVSAQPLSPQRSLFAGGISLTNQGATVKPSLTLQHATGALKSQDSATLSPISPMRASRNKHQATTTKTRWQAELGSFLEYWPVQMSVLFVTIWAIFGDDVRLLLISPLHDGFFEVLNWVIMVIFCAEYFITLLSNPKYFWTVFSILDVLSILSMIPMHNITELTQQIFMDDNNGNFARTGRAAKVGAKAGRIVKATRFLRLGRLVMEALSVNEASKRKESDLQLKANLRTKTRGSSDTSGLSGTSGIDTTLSLENGIERSSPSDDPSTSPSDANSLSQRLSKDVTVKVVIIIFLLLLVYPFLGMTCDAFGSLDEVFKNLNDACLSCGDAEFVSDLTEKVVSRFHADSPYGELLYFEACNRVLVDYTSSAPKRASWVKLHSNAYTAADLSSREDSDICEERICRGVYGTPSSMTCCDYLLQSSSMLLSNVTVAVYMENYFKKDAFYSLFFLQFVLFLLITSTFVISNGMDSTSKHISGPVKTICAQMKELRNLKHMDAGSEGEVTAIDEVQELQESFQSLQNAILSFARYVPAAVVKDLMASSSKTKASIKVARRTITIFFSDIKGFTAICEKLSPSQILELLTEYFDAMEEIVSATNGTILEYIGDAVLAVWNAPELDDLHAMHGLDCALRMQVKLCDLRSDWKGRGLPEVRIRVGVHTAEVFYGNLGSHKRLKYGVLGDGVNLASRLEELNKRYGTEILVSSDTYNSNAVTDMFLARPVDVVVVKGKSVPTTLWEIVAERCSSDALAEEICGLQKEAMTDFLLQKFDQCCIKMKLAFQKEEEHATSYTRGGAFVRMQYNTTKILFSRAQGMVGSQKVPAWDGSEILNEKHF